MQIISPVPPESPCGLPVISRKVSTDTHKNNNTPWVAGLNRIQAHVGEQFMVMFRNHQYMYEHYRPTVSE